MPLHAVLSLFCFLALLFLGNFVYFLDRKRPTHRLFLLMSVAFAYWAFCEFMTNTSAEVDRAYFWQKVLSAWPFTVALLSHFLIHFTERARWLRRRWVWPALYLPAAFFAGVEISTDIFVGELTRGSFGYQVHQVDAWPTHALTVWAVGMTFFCLGISGTYAFRAENPQRRKQALSVMAGFAAVFAGGLTDLWAGIHDVEIPALLTPSFLLFAFLVGVAIWRHRLFIISPATAAEILVSTMPSGCVLVDEEEKIVVVNPSFLDMSGHAAPSVLGRPLSHFLRDLRTTRWRAQAQDRDGALLTREDVPLEVSYSVSPLRRPGGRTIGHVVIVQDRTDRRRVEREKSELERRLFQSEKALLLGRLAGGVAHELNNPLGVILGFSQILLKGRRPDDPLFPKLSGLESEALRSRSLLKKLLPPAEDRP
jgi:PAS domain S-box-containing protein